MGADVFPKNLPEDDRSSSLPPLLEPLPPQQHAERPKTLDEQLEWMKRDWDERAKENARFYVASGRDDWTDDDFFASGELGISQDVISDLTTICQGKYPADMRIIEIGCGVGRLTRALSRIFGEVHAVDVSSEMVARAKTALADRPNVYIYHNNGCDLGVLPPLEYDFAYSFIVFQHIPSREIIESYVRDAGRLLRPGALFKFQVQGSTQLQTLPQDTWYGASFSVTQAKEMAERCGFELGSWTGAEGQYFWLWFFKKPAPQQYAMPQADEASAIADSPSRSARIRIVELQNQYADLQNQYAAMHAALALERDALRAERDGLRAECDALRAERELVRESRWIKLGRTISLGPRFD